MNITERIINNTMGMPLATFGASRRMADSGSSISGSTDTGDFENGSDILLNVGGSCLAKCSTHNVQYITAHGEAFRFYKASENGFEECAAMWGKGQAVELQAFKRGSDSSPYLKGKFVITAMEETNPANDDATWTIDLENDGTPEIYPGKTAS